MRPRSIPAIAVIGMIGLLAATAPLARAQTTSIRDYTVEKKDEAVAYAKKATADLEAKIKELEAQEGFANAYRDLAVAYDKAVAEFKK